MTLSATQSYSWTGIKLKQTALTKWLAVCVVFSMLFFTYQLRTMAVLILVGVTGLYALTLTKAEVGRVLKALPILAYPGLAVASTLWSEAPDITLRISLQFLVTAALGVLFYRTVPIRLLLSALFFAALIACLAAPIYDNKFLIYRQPLHGIAGSKNMMAVFASLLVMFGLSIATMRGETFRMRAIAAGGTAYGLLTLFWAQSAGAWVGTVLGSAILIAVRIFVGASGPMRTLSVVAVLLMVPVGVISQQLVASEAVVFGQDVLGKDTTTLTGRTYLWQRASEYIAEKPIIGHGYAAFWRQGSVEAEGLWRMYAIVGRSGFNFHNQLLESAVDIGVVGLAIFVGMLIVTTLALGLRVLNQRGAELPFIGGMFVYLLLRVPLESVTLTVFNLPTVMLFLVSTAAIYGQAAAPARAPLAQRRGGWPQQAQWAPGGGRPELADGPEGQDDPPQGRSRPMGPARPVLRQTGARAFRRVAARTDPPEGA